ncbi:FUSC family protein [Pleurocapsales cyanobacterium LEGE 10410]|nr:FUSC family protein [Pleurocapsales cyanobacterium LEGE 10410]
MNSSEHDLQSRLNEMEAEIKQNTSDSHDSQNNNKSVFPEVEINPSPQLKSWIDFSREKFDTLPKFGKAAVAIAGVWLGVSIAGALLQVVSSIFTIATIGFVLYLGYRFFNNTEAN